MSDLGITGDFLDSLTLDDIDDIESITGVSIDELFGGNTAVAKGKLMKALALVMKRRIDPTVTLDQIGALPLVEFEKLLEGQVQPNPPAGAAA